MLLAGCSVLRLAYPQVPTLAYWWLDGYVDFNDSQAPRVREQLDELFRWHRSNQLPDYVALLARAQAEVQADATAARMCAWFDELAARLDAAYGHALPAAAEIALTLTPAQVDAMERKFAKSNEEFRADYLQATPASRLKAAVKRSVERAESLYGRLDEAQRERIAREVAASPFDPDLWQAERLQRQRDILQTLRRLQADRASPEQAQAALGALAEQARHSPREAHRAYQQRLLQANCAVAALVHNGTTPAQRQVAAATFKGWETDLRALATPAAAK